MREIKFRAWGKKENKFMVEGFHILGELVLIGGLFQDKNLEYIDNIILTQYTGLKDKNGKEIYEGDIVRIKREHPFAPVDYQIDFEGGSFMMYICPDSHSSCFIEPDICEVIGNVHQNPDLLK